MKKIVYLILGIIFIIPSATLATSGACSSHGGVNCLAGPTYEGKVSCNDGWVNSSVYFYEAQECNNQESEIRKIDHEISNLEYKLSQIKTNWDTEKSQTTGFLAHIGALRTDGSSPVALANIDSKYQGQITAINNEISYYKKLRKQYRDELSDIRDAEMQRLELINKNEGSVNNNELSKEFDTLNEKYFGKEAYDKACVTQYGSNSGWDGKKKDDGSFYCKCSAGYFMGKNKKCISLSSWCEENLANSYPKNNQCLCKEGFSLNDKSKKCEQSQETTQVNSYDEQLQNTSNSLPQKEISSTSSTLEQKNMRWYKRFLNWLFE